MRLSDSEELKPLKPLITRKQLATYLGVSTRTIANWQTHKQIPEPLLKDSRCHYWSRFQIRNWLRQKPTNQES